MTARALIVMAHGSRVESSNDEVRGLAQEMQQQMAEPGRYVQVVPAFMELGSPRLDEATQALLDQGITEIDVMPYFLTAGKHIRRDIPSQMRQLEAQYPQTDFNLLPYLGCQRAALGQLMLQSVLAA